MLHSVGHRVQVKPGTARSTNLGRLEYSHALLRSGRHLNSQYRGLHQQRWRSLPGESNTASKATSWLLDGPTAAAQDVGELLLRRWVGLREEGHLPVREETFPLRDTGCVVTTCATLVTADKRRHVLVAVIITDADPSSGSSGFSVSQLVQPMLHWGCASGHGDRWQEPPPGWSTWPDVSHDARHGAWQTPFHEQDLPGVGPALTLLLQLPWDGALRHGGLSFLIKTRSNTWLGNGATYKDFFFSTSQLPEMPLVSAPSSSISDNNSGISGPERTLDVEKLSKAPPPPPPSKERKHHKHHHNHHHQQNHHHHETHQQQQHHAEEPELPNAGRREKEPANDETQVCTLTARELRSAAAAQLGAWMRQHTDLEVPPTGLEVMQHEFPVKGHPSTPFVVATMVMLQRRHEDGLEAACKEPVLLVAAMADIGVTGTRKPGLVLQWCAAAAATSSQGQPQPQPDLPSGWKTLPDLSWDAGAGFWDTPMSRHLFEGTSAAAMGKLDRPLSPAPDGHQDSAHAVKQSSDPSNMYMALLRLPLSGAFSTGGLMISMRTARRQWLRHGESKGCFFVDTSLHLKQLGSLQAPDASFNLSSGSSSSSTFNPEDVAKHKAVAAAGLSESEMMALQSRAPPASSAPAPPAGNVSAAALAVVNNPERINAVLTSADAEMEAHIAAQSLLVDTARGSSSSTRAKLAQSKTEPQGTGSDDKLYLLKFLKDFDPAPVPASDMLWGLQEGAAASDIAEAPELVPNHNIVKRIADAEHKARRSLMHRYNLAADFVQELLPDLRAAAAAAPESLTWPPAAASGNSSGTAAKGVAAMAGLVAVAVWLRFSSLRLLTWNHNYNVKPREISAALDRLGASLVQVYESCPQLSGVVLLALASAGRGGEGDMGQRIRDEILAIQQRNNCKGGMMEEWHQKLHNNSSPDDLTICQALLDYLASGQQQQVYWDSLAKEGINAQRLASYDRPIYSAPPTFSQQQVPGLTEDLIAYRRTLAAVHSGADLSAAIDGVLGYDAGECKGKRVKVEPLTGVATPQLRKMLSALLLLVQGGGSGSSGSSNKVSAMMEMEKCLKLQALVVQARHLLAPALRGGNGMCQGRLRDVLFLDLALETTGRGALEAGLAAVRSAAPSTLLGGLLALLQQPVASACMSAMPGQGGSAVLVSVAGQLAKLSQECPGLDATARARHALSLLERLRTALASLSAGTTALLQPTTDSVAGALGLPSTDSHGPVQLLSEEVVRGSAAAALSLLLTAVEPSLRRLAGVSTWSVVSRLPPAVTGTLSPLTPCLSQLPASVLKEPTILVLQRLAGEEEVPPGVVGMVVLGDCPDVLSHCAVRARNCKIPVVACPSSEEGHVAHVTGLAGKQVTLSIQGDEVTLSEAKDAPKPTSTAGAHSAQAEAPKAAKATLTAAPVSAWDGEWVLTMDEFASGVVGQKSLSTTNLHQAAQKAAAAAAAAAASGSKGTRSSNHHHPVQLPSWVKLPASVALPHGSFEAVLRAPLNRDMATRLQELVTRIAAAAEKHPGSTDACATELEQIRSMVADLKVPPGLMYGLQQHLGHLAAAQAASSAGSNGTSSSALYDWEAVWSAVKGVWASQWNTRAVAALGKAGLPLEHLRMGVLLQPLLPARYSWVAHTVNPATGVRDEVCVQLVVGLGEALVGNHPGRALGGIVSRTALVAALEGHTGRGAPVPQEKDLLAAVDVVSYPSKDAAIVPQGLQLPSCGGSSGGSGSTGGWSDGVHAVFMARSDSNAEDLPGFAGAGLFDSVATVPTSARLINYTKEPMAWDKAAAAALLWQCALAAVAAEGVLEQQGDSSESNGLDVEGCITVDGSMWVVQARPQV